MKPITDRIRSTNIIHKRRCIAAFLHERTKQGKPTTIREAAAAYGWDARHINSVVRSMVGEIIDTTFGPVIVQHTGRRTSTGGVTANVYAAILYHETPNQ